MINLLKRKFRDLIYPLKELLALIPVRCKLLDVGCGQGQFLNAVATNRSPVQLGGFEISDSLIDVARSELAFHSGVSADLRVYDGTSFPAEVAQYNIVSLIDVLHHIPKHAQSSFVLALFNAMKPGAFFLLKDIDASRPLLCMANRLHDFLLGAGGRQERSKVFVERLLTTSGFEVVSSGERRILWYPHYWFLVVKV